MYPVRNTVNDRPMVGDYHLDSYVSDSSGETVYTISDSIGLVYTSIFLSKIEPFFADSK